MQRDSTKFIIRKIGDPHPGGDGDRQVEEARALFAEYGLFLKVTQSCEYFNYATFEGEIAALPKPYTSRRGDILLAYAGGEPIACIAFRVSFAEWPESCEIKRLYVRPACRGAGVARMLVLRMLEDAKAFGYRRAILDTDAAHMAGALKLYTTLDFAEYKARQGSIAFLERGLD